MLKLIITILVATGLALAGQKSVVIKKIVDAEKKIIEVEAVTKDGQLQVTVEQNGDAHHFSVPLEDQEALDELKESLAELDVELDLKTLTGKASKLVVRSQGGFLGVQIQDLTGQLRTYFQVDDEVGILITAVEEDSPAEEAQLKAGDIITAVDEKQIGSAAELTRAIRGYKPGEEVSLSLIRKGRKKSVTATLGEQEEAYSIGRPHGGIFHSDEDEDYSGFFFFQPGKDKFKDFQFFYPPTLRKELKELRQELEELREELKKLSEK